VALVRTAGGIVTDLAGNDWTPQSQAALAGVPQCHEQVLEILRDLGDPGGY
jgi:myo-inositol-1(or 4)-monophosphatase